MKVFLAGASGVIGRSLIPRLTRAAHDVTGMTSDAATAGLVRSLGAQPVVVDVFDRDRLAEVLRAEHPDAVIHQLTSLRKGNYAATNRLRTEGTRNLVDAALSAGTHLDDAAEAAVQALGWPAGPVNIVDDEPAPGLDWLPVYAAAVGAPAPRKQLGTGSGLRGASNSRARKDYGWEPIHPSWREGFRTALG